LIRFLNFILLATLIGLKSFAQEVPALWPQPTFERKWVGDTLLYLQPNGQLALKCWYNPERMDSLFLGFDSLGRPEIVFEGKRRIPLQGCGTWLWEDGRPKEKTCWSEDKPDGEFQQFDPAGVVRVTGRFANGEKVGIWKNRFASGSLESLGRYRFDLKDGRWQYFHPDSLSAFEEVWAEGALMSISDFTTSTGGRLPGGSAEQGFGQVIRYHLNGKRKQVFQLRGGLPHGSFSEFDSLGRILRIRQYENGEANGWLREFYPDSVLASETYFLHGSESGRYRAFFPDGKVELEGYFRSGLEDSLWTEFNEAGKILSHTHFRFGKPSGEVLEFYPDGNRKSRSWFTEGIQDSTQELWSEKGKLTNRTRFSDGQKNGLSQEWYPNGNRKAEGYFLNDLESGAWTSWFEDGKLQARGNFLLGQPEGSWETWYPNGKPASKGAYKNGREDGSWLFYYPNGSLKSEEIWKEGALDQVLRCLHPKGKKLSPGSLKNGEGNLKTYDNEGFLEGEGPMKKGYPNGTWTYYFPTGRVMATGKLQQGQRIGKWQFRKPDGSLAEEVDFGKGEN
jgi:antitoxin component YwqK of YwqJK toxin-antitoxin module